MRTTNPRPTLWCSPWDSIPASPSSSFMPSQRAPPSDSHLGVPSHASRALLGRLRSAQKEFSDENIRFLLATERYAMYLPRPPQRPLSVLPHHRLRHDLGGTARATL